MKHKTVLFTRLVGLITFAFATGVSAKATSKPTISPASQTISAIVGQQIQSTTAFEAKNFGGPPTYTINPSLPEGLGFNSSSGVLAGTPTIASTQTRYTISAKYKRKIARSTLFVTVNQASVLGTAQSTAEVTTQSRTQATLTPSSQVLIGTVGKALETSVFRAANFGSTPISYSIQPAPPQGLILNAGTGVLSGTPTSVSAQANYVVTAQSSSAKATASITLSVVQSGGSSAPTSGLNCPDAAQAATETAAIQGRRAYLRLNCYGCHGDYAQGGTMGPNVQGDGGDVAEALRGDGGMPSFTSALCPNDATNLSAYLNSVKALQTSKTPQLLDWKTYPGNQFTTVAPGIANFH